MTPHILTCGGRYFNLAEPDAKQITAYDLAHSLSHLCRFTGHTNDFYSVAQHCVFVSTLVPRSLALQALVHDAHKAFIGNVPPQLKSLLPGFEEVERRIAAAVRERFGVPAECDPTVVRANLVARATERRDLMPHNDSIECEDLRGVEPVVRIIKPLGPIQARRSFLWRLGELMGDSARLGENAA